MTTSLRKEKKMVEAKIPMSDALFDALKKEAAVRGISLAKLIREACEELLVLHEVSYTSAKRR